MIPNFSVGMVLLQQAAAAAARFYDFAELTELHHNRKADAPSGTCIKTAELMEDLGKSFNPLQHLLGVAAAEIELRACGHRGDQTRQLSGAKRDEHGASVCCRRV